MKPHKIKDVMNYDPTLTYNLNIAKQKVRLTFAVWEYRADFEVYVSSNTLGLDVIKTALEDVYEEMLPVEELFGESYRRFSLSDKEGNTILVEEENSGGFPYFEPLDFLGNMLIKAEILSIEPDKSMEEL